MDDIDSDPNVSGLLPHCEQLATVFADPGDAEASRSLAARAVAVQASISTRSAPAEQQPATTAVPGGLNWRLTNMFASLSQFAGRLGVRSAVGAVGVVALTGGLAAADTLPDPLQDSVASVAAVVGIDLPGPDSGGDEFAGGDESDDSEATEVVDHVELDELGDDQLDDETDDLDEVDDDDEDAVAPFDDGLVLNFAVPAGEDDDHADDCDDDGDRDDEEGEDRDDEDDDRDDEDDDDDDRDDDRDHEDDGDCDEEDPETGGEDEVAPSPERRTSHSDDSDDEDHDEDDRDHEDRDDEDDDHDEDDDRDHEDDDHEDD